MFSIEVSVKSMSHSQYEQLRTVFNLLTKNGMKVTPTCTASADYGPYKHNISEDPDTVTPASMVVYDGMKGSMPYGTKLFSRGEESLRKAAQILSQHPDTILHVDVEPEPDSVRESRKKTKVQKRKAAHRAPNTSMLNAG